MPHLNLTMNSVAVSFERAKASPLLRMAAGTVEERPKKSQWISWPRETSNGPPSHFTPPDQKCGRRKFVSVSAVEYWSSPWKPPHLGVSQSTAFCARSWKRPALLVPNPRLRLRSLVEVKLPLETPRKEMSSA